MKLVTAIKFPILSFSQGLVDVEHDLESLTTCNKRALRRGGYYSKLWLVDSGQHKFNVKSAKKLHGVGLFWGYNIFLNQRIRVELVFEDKVENIPLEDVKAAVFKSFRTWHGWASADDFDELQSKVKNATSVREIMDAIDKHRRGRGA
jgi:hypothetical protein